MMTMDLIISISFLVDMKVKRVLYTDRFTADLRTKLRIIKFDKMKSQKNNVYAVYFASKEDAEYACKTSKRMIDVTMMPFQSKPSIVVSKEKTTPPTKITLTARYLPPNAPEIQQILENLAACLNTMHILENTFDEIDQINHTQNEAALSNRLYTQHSTASYMKMALVMQLKAISFSHLRLGWSIIAVQINQLQRHVSREQIFVKNIESKGIYRYPHINFQSSITTSSKLAYELMKLTHE